jgi:hypothetical protein
MSDRRPIKYSEKRIKDVTLELQMELPYSEALKRNEKITQEEYQKDILRMAVNKVRVEAISKDISVNMEYMIDTKWDSLTAKIILEGDAILIDYAYNKSTKETDKAQLELFDEEGELPFSETQVNETNSQKEQKFIEASAAIITPVIEDMKELPEPENCDNNCENCDNEDCDKRNYDWVEEDEDE